jgi:hypothetical protein
MAIFGNKTNIEKLADATLEAVENISGTKRRRRRRMTVRILKYLSYGIIIFTAVMFLIVLAHFSLFKRVYSETANGKGGLVSAANFIKNKEFDKAIGAAEYAESNFSKAKSDLSEANESIFIKNALVMKSEIDNLIDLLDTMIYLSEAAKEGGRIGHEVKSVIRSNPDFSYSNLSTQDKRNILSYVYHSTGRIETLRSVIQNADQEIGQVRTFGILWPIRNQIGQLKSVLDEANLMLENAVPMTKLFPAMLGYPQKSSYLVLLQNSDELRPTGGFLGTFGLVETETGEFTRFETHDIYHIDMPAKDSVKVKPPYPIEKYLVPSWYMRDANWSPDWPVAARQIEWFYKLENGSLKQQYPVKDFDFVIAVTPAFITDLLKITGPINVEGVEYNEDNFTKLLEYRVEKDYVQLGIPSWQRKEVIGEIAKTIKIKIFDSPANGWMDIFRVLQASSDKKDIMIFSNGAVLEKLIEYIGLDGGLKSAPGDYLMVVDANLAAFKTDAVIDRSMDYKITERPDGLYADLKLTYRHNGGYDWRTTKYRTYTRVFVPKGSELKNVEGMTDGQPYSGIELGKTFFGAFIAIEPGKTGTLNFHYKLPDDIVKNDEYDLYVQKQPGRLSDLTVSLETQKKIESFNPTGFKVVKKQKSVNWNTDFDTDKIFKIKF